MDDKYKHLLDDETRDFVETTLRFYPAESENLTIEQQRKYYNALCRYFHAGYPDGVASKDGEIIDGARGTIPVRSYALDYSLDGAPGVAQVVYFHGGGYVVGDLDSHDDICAEICARTGFAVTSVDYRLAPEHTYPDDFNDALAGFEHVAGRSGLPVVVVGDSAGGNLAAAVSHACRAKADGSGNRPVGQVLIYPGLGSDLTSGTFVEHENAPMLSTAETKFYKAMRTANNDSVLQQATCSPLNDEHFSDLPPTVIFSAQCDPLSGDGLAYHEALLNAGGKSAYFNETGLVHGFLRARHTVERARQSFTRIIAAIEALGKREWPF